MASADASGDRIATAPAARVAIVKPTHITWMTLALTQDAGRRPNNTTRAMQIVS